MHVSKKNVSKYQYITNFIVLWLVIWYLIGSLVIFISELPSVSIWNIQESVTCESTSWFTGACQIEQGSIVNVLIPSIIWPILVFFFLTGGWIIAGEVVGSKYDRGNPIIIFVYYITLIQSFLILFVIGFISGLSALIIARRRRT